jgi:hypothetical protein
MIGNDLERECKSHRASSPRGTTRSAINPAGPSRKADGKAGSQSFEPHHHTDLGQSPGRLKNMLTVCIRMK